MKIILAAICIITLLTSFTFSSEINFSEIESWTAADSISNYDSSNLWEYINGAADLFLIYGFQDLQSCELSSGDIEVVVDVYNMGNALNAFGIYKTESGEGQEKLRIGTEAVITSPNQCLMLKGSYYIKINVFEGELSNEKGQNLLKLIAEILPGSNDFPGEFELLPKADKIENSEHFAKEGFLGLSELNNILYADYQPGFQYFIILPETNQNQELLWENFNVKWKKIDSQTESILFRKIPYKGLVGITITSKRIFGITNSQTEAELKERLLQIK